MNIAVKKEKRQNSGRTISGGNFVFFHFAKRTGIGLGGSGHFVTSSFLYPFSIVGCQYCTGPNCSANISAGIRAYSCIYFLNKALSFFPSAIPM